jgi:hypothetical protein
VFDKIADAARQGCRPLLHIDMHGSIEHGLEIADSKEFMSWPALAGKLRGINVATGNNTCVIAASCFAFHAIKQVSIARASPFFVLVAPEDKATVGFLEAKTAAFYAELLSTLDIMEAIANHLTPAMKTFHCERMFMIGLARYILRYCVGKGATERRESLLTDSISVTKSHGDMRAMRKSIKNAIKPDQALAISSRPYSWPESLAALRSRRHEGSRRGASIEKIAPCAGCSLLRDHRTNTEHLATILLPNPVAAHDTSRYRMDRRRKYSQRKQDVAQLAATG